MYLGVLSMLFIPLQGAFAWETADPCCENSSSLMSNLNPLPYIGIGENRTTFSLNPFKGFKNCNPCKIQVKECDTCTGAAAPICPNCVKAFPKCDACDIPIIIPLQPIYVEEPKCPCMD